ncbi:Uncharacterised protein [Mycobacteroides abscessus subsp. abscessus]|nr:Uncharacterised protein [Mycobacteroides abscessus]SKT71750.1 Uncharacterised protein [Mycobacteroides abscessus subsp. abscessus]
MPAPARIALKNTMDWFDTPAPVSCEYAATTDWAMTRDEPMVTNGSIIVSALR